jgi:hypothetical protein
MNKRKWRTDSFPILKGGGIEFSISYHLRFPWLEPGELKEFLSLLAWVKVLEKEKDKE